MHTSWINVNEPYERGVDAVRRASCCSRRAATRSSPTCGASCGGIADARASATRSRSWSSRSPRPASPTSTRGPSCGTCRWSIPTTAGPSTTPARRALLDELGRARRRGAAARSSPSCSRQPGGRRAQAAGDDARARPPARHRALFERGAYLPLAAEGARARHVVAFARALRRRRVHHDRRPSLRSLRAGGAPPGRRGGLGRHAPPAAGWLAARPLPRRR